MFGSWHRRIQALRGTRRALAQCAAHRADPEEAQLKAKAIYLSRESFVLADHTKFGEVSFSEFAKLHQAKIITNEEDSMILEKYREKTEIYCAPI